MAIHSQTSIHWGIDLLQTTPVPEMGIRDVGSVSVGGLGGL